MDRMILMYDYSIIVPLLGKLPEFEETLASVLRHRPENSQIVVAHDGRYDDPYGLRKEVDFVVADQRRALAGLLNEAFQAARGGIAVVVRPSVAIDEGFELTLASSFADPLVASVSPLLVAESRPSRIVAAGVDCDWTCTRLLVGHGENLNSGSVGQMRSLGPTSWLAAYRTDALKLAGPLDERLDNVYLDLEISLTLRQLGLQSTLNLDFIGTMESEVAIVAEAAAPHGLSAERAKIRHGFHDDASTIRTCLFEATQIARHPWKLKHLAQRIGARKLRPADELYSRSIEAKRDALGIPRSEPAKSGEPSRRHRAA